MTRTRTTLTVIGLMLVLACGPPALAEMSCQDFTRAYVLQDSDVLAEAQEIAQPWFDTATALMTKPGATDGTKHLLASLHMSQLASDCEALPTDTVDRIVATHLKTAQRQLALLEQQRAAEPPALPVQPRLLPSRAAIADRARACYKGGTLEMDQKRVMLKVTIDAGGVTRKAEVTGDDVARMGDPRFRDFAERAVQAVLDPECAKLPLPPDMQGKVNTLTFRFTNG